MVALLFGDENESGLLASVCLALSQAIVVAKLLGEFVQSNRQIDQDIRLVQRDEILTKRARQEARLRGRVSQ